MIYMISQPLQVGAYTLSAKSVTKNVIFVLEHFVNEFFLLSQFFLRVQVYTFMVFLTQKNFDQNSRRLLILNVGGLAKKWRLLFEFGSNRRTSHSVWTPHIELFQNPDKHNPTIWRGWSAQNMLKTS